MDDLEQQARSMALEDAQEAVAAWFGQRLDSRRPKPPPQQEPPAPEQGGDVDLDSLASLLEGA